MNVMIIITTNRKDISGKLNDKELITPKRCQDLSEVCDDN